MPAHFPAESSTAGVEFKNCQTWVVPEDSASPLILRPVFGDDISIDDALAVWHQPRVPMSNLGLTPGATISVIGDCVAPRLAGPAMP